MLTCSREDVGGLEWFKARAVTERERERERENT